MKKYFDTPEFEVVRLSNDIIATSIINAGTGEQPTSNEVMGRNIWG